MEIRKHYDIGEMAEQLQEKIKKSVEYGGGVELDILKAQDILDVLCETHRRERKHQTLESALTFVEKEDGTQTNLMEEANREPECFGMLRNNDTWNVCEECPYIEQCKVVTEHE